MSIDLSASLDLGALDAQAIATGEPLKLDPKTIRPSRWVNRADDSFQSEAFASLKDEIADAGGNVQPIKIRPLTPPEGEVQYEIVFGHRRHRACLELGIDISAVVEEVGDQQLWAQMERENRAREPLSAYEQGRMYQRALQEGLFPSLQALARAIGRDPGDISKAITIATLPTEVVNAFSSPGDIRFRDASPLRAAIKENPSAVLETARELAANGDAQPAAEVVKQLTAAAVGPSNSNHAGIEHDPTKATKAPADSAVGPSNKAKEEGAQAKSKAASAQLRVVVEMGAELMEVVTDCKPRKDRIPVRSVGSKDQPQYVQPAKVRIVRVEAST